MAVATAQALGGNVVMTVDGRDVPRWQLELAKRQLLMQVQGGPVPDSDVMRRRAVDQVIGEALLAEAASKAGIVVSDAEVKASLAQQRAAVGKGAGVADAMAKAGITEAEFERFEHDRILVGRFIEKDIAPSVKITPDEVERYYRDNPAEFQHDYQVHVWMILCVVPPGSGKDVEAAARDKAEKALARLQAGEEFSSVAKDLSDDPSKAQGGLIGWVRRGMLLPELDPIVFALKPGDLSGVVRSLRGYHVIRVDGQRGPGKYPLDEIRPALERMLRTRQINAAIESLVKERRAKAVVVAVDPEVKDVLAAEPPVAKP